MCHKKDEVGKQYKIWQDSKHAKAFETLGTQAAKDAGAKLGVTDPQTDGKCLKCHSTAYGLTDKKVTVRDRDTMKQDRVALGHLKEYFKEKFNN